MNAVHHLPWRHPGDAPRSLSPPRPPASEGLGEQGYRFGARARNKAVSSACRHPSHLLPLAREKVTTRASGTRVNGASGPKGGGHARSKERRTPMARPPGIPGSSQGQALPCGCAGGFRGAATGLLSRRRTDPHPCGPSCGLSSTHPPRHRGPGRAARSPRAEARARALQERCALALAFASGAHDAHPLFQEHLSAYPPAGERRDMRTLPHAGEESRTPRQGRHP